MSEIIKNILYLNTGILLFSLVLSVLLYVRDKNRVNMGLIYAWGALIVSSVMAGTLTGSELAILLGYTGSTLLSIFLARLGALLHRIVLPYANYVIFLVVIVGIVLVMDWAGLPFWAKALPLSIATVVPIVDCIRRLLKLPTGSISMLGVILLVIYGSISLHNLNYPFLRLNESFAPMGFTIATINSAMLAIITPAIVLERTSLEKTALAQMKQMKDKFFANISHELRTPLTMISAPIEAMLTKPQQEDQRKDLLSVKRNSARLLLFIDELLDLARLDAGRLELTVSKLELSTVFEAVYEAMAATARVKGIELHLLQTDTTPNLYADRHRMEIIVTNLVSNAVKHTPEGSKIELSVADQEDKVIATIRDTGPGIPQEEAKNIFDRFQQGKEGAERGGVGIGLALCKELVELHGGTIVVDSVVGEGTAFVFELPKGKGHFSEDHIIVARQESEDDIVSGEYSESVSLARSQTESGEPPAYPLGIVVLVEDNPDLRRFVATILKKEFIVYQAENGEEALKIIKRERPDAVVTDIMMPVMDGIELCRKIRSQPEIVSTPIVLLTAKSGSSTELEAYSVGANDFVGKPFHPGVLLARVTAQVQLRKLAAQLVSSEKLAALGTMAAGIAHEIQNPVNSVVNAASLLKRPGVDLSVIAKMADVIEDGSGRISNIVSAITKHARPADPLARCRVREGIESTVKLLAYRLSNTKVHLNIDAQVRANISAAKANQVFLNIIDNAGNHNAKNLYIDAAVKEKRLIISIADDGPGIPPEIVTKIFDPFFTTREQEQGTGLGLYICHQIVNEAGGSIRVSPVHPHGARFEIDLPNYV